MAKESPILFTMPNLQSIQAGDKTQTRRILKPQPDMCQKFFFKGLGSLCPYGRPGDLLWVREGHAWADKWMDGEERDEPVCVVYRSDLATYRFEPDPFHVETDDPTCWVGIEWRSPIHMPKWAARIWLKVVYVKVEQLQDIMDDDILAEGIKGPGLLRSRFIDMWNDINASRGYSWNDNPWVWRVQFKVGR